MPLRAIAAFFTLFSLCLTFFGCTAAESAPELLHIVDVVPREAEVGDRMEVIGSSFPEGRPAKIIFDGTLYRPGQKPRRGFELAVDAVSTSYSRVELMVTEELRGAFCGYGDLAIHTTFEGNLIVSFTGAPGALPITGSLRGVRLDFRPLAQRQAILLEREKEGERALDFMGIHVAADAPASGGLLVTEIRAGSSADQAGIFPGDLIRSFDGVRVFDRGDILPSGASRFAQLGIVRGASIQPAGREVIRSVDIQGYWRSASSDLLGAGLLLLLMAAGVVLFGKPFGNLITWLEGRILSRLQSRTRSRQFQSVRSFLRTDILLSEGTSEPLFPLAPYLVFFGISAIFISMPFGQHLIAANLDIGILFAFATSLLITMGLLEGGFSARWSLRSSLTAIAQIISCQLPGAIAIACIVMMTGSLRAKDIVLSQGAWPWQWFVFKSPITFALFGLWLSTSLLDASMNEKRGKADIGNISSDSPGMRGLFLFFAEWGNVFVMCGLAAILFLGGWQLPFVAPITQSSNFWLEVLGALWFQFKSWMLIFIVIGARTILPRVKIERILPFVWKFLVPGTLAAFLLIALLLFWSPSEAIEKLISYGTFTLFLFKLAYFGFRLRRDSRKTSGQIQLSPLL